MPWVRAANRFCSCPWAAGLTPAHTTKNPFDMNIDKDEGVKHGQQLEDTLQLSDLSLRNSYPIL